MVVSVDDAIAIEGGTLVAGITLTIVVININAHGVSFDLTSDINRQKLLNFLGLFVGVFGLISLGLNKTGQTYILNDVSIVIIFLGIQLGLCCVIHNTIVRGYVASNRKGGFSVQQVSRWSIAIYPLVFVVLIPIWIGFTQANGVAVNLTTINKVVFKPLNIALVVSAQLLATISDIVLLRVVARSMHVGEVVTNGSGISGIAEGKPLFKQYALIWATVVLDVIIKILIYQGYPVLFDSQISNLTLVLRAHTNLVYGLNLKRLRNLPSANTVLTNVRHKTGGSATQSGVLNTIRRDITGFAGDEESMKGRSGSKSNVGFKAPRQTSKGDLSNNDFVHNSIVDESK
ncbi:hypothetical protein HDU87_006988 [Geranomyces variabilis]|uniref:Uncharacterized protein n=1 Tax=Geranomyces variabilis TaxID=109894 RepID=A0AAD5XN49_9FUNG|nr:hypothetical protein HDU87_006988 [Geranomyces variabilis]